MDYEEKIAFIRKKNAGSLPWEIDQKEERQKISESFSSDHQKRYIELKTKEYYELNGNDASLFGLHLFLAEGIKTIARQQNINL